MTRFILEYMYLSGDAGLSAALLCRYIFLHNCLGFDLPRTLFGSDMQEAILSIIEHGRLALQDPYCISLGCLKLCFVFENL